MKPAIYGILQNEVVLITGVKFINNVKHYKACMKRGGPTFSILAEFVFVPKDQTIIKLLYKKAS